MSQTSLQTNVKSHVIADSIPYVCSLPPHGLGKKDEEVKAKRLQESDQQEGKGAESKRKTEKIYDVKTQRDENQRLEKFLSSAGAPIPSTARKKKAHCDPKKISGSPIPRVRNTQIHKHKTRLPGWGFVKRKPWAVI